MITSWNVDRRLGEQRQRDPQEAVGADLREHRREQDQHRQRRGPVGVGHPAVDREGRHLDQEGGGEEAEDPLLAAAREQVSRCSAGIEKVSSPLMSEASTAVAIAPTSISSEPTSV